MGTVMKYFGLSESAIKSDYGFVLVKLVKPRASLEVEGNLRLQPDADAVYQILAMDWSSYARAKTDVLVEKRVTDFDEIYENYLAPWIVRENGQILAASGDPRVGEFLAKKAV